MGECLLRRLSLVVLAVMAAIPVLAGCETGGSLQSLTLEPGEVTMQSRGENVQLKVVGKRPDGTLAEDRDMDLSWTYGDGSIATVDETGLVRGVLPGTTTVTVKSKRFDKAATITVKVLPARFTPEQMQAKVKAVIDAVKALEVSPATTDDVDAAKDQLKDILRHLTEGNKYIGQGTNNTLASVELGNAANFMEVFLPRAKGPLAEGFAQNIKLARQYRDELLMY